MKVVILTPCETVVDGVMRPVNVGEVVEVSERVAAGMINRGEADGVDPSRPPTVNPTAAVAPRHDSETLTLDELPDERER